MRIDSENEFDAELNKVGEEEGLDHSRPFLIPNDSMILTLIDDNVQIVEKIYQTFNGENISVKF